jgi:hypothetical protein
MRPLLIASFALATALPALAEAPVRHAFASSTPRAGVQTAVIDIPAGDITIRNGASDRIAISGVASREPDGPRSRDKQQRIVDDISAEIYVSNGEAVVRRRFGPEARGFSGETFTRMLLIIEVPEGMNIDLLTRFGDIKVDGRFGDIDIALRAGAIAVRTPRADVRELHASCRLGNVVTNLGHETLERAGVFPRRINFTKPEGRSAITVHTTAGDVNVTLTQ